MALRLSVESAVDKLMADFLLDALRNDLYKESGEEKPGAREIHHEAKLTKHQASKIGRAEHQRTARKEKELKAKAKVVHKNMKAHTEYEKENEK